MFQLFILYLRAASMQSHRSVNLRREQPRGRFGRGRFFSWKNSEEKEKRLCDSQIDFHYDLHLEYILDH